MYISLYRRLCLHVIMCCKYFILSSVILPLNVQGTAGVSENLVCTDVDSHTPTFETIVLLETVIIQLLFPITHEGWKVRQGVPRMRGRQGKPLDRSSVNENE